MNEAKMKYQVPKDFLSEHRNPNQLITSSYIQNHLGAHVEIWRDSEVSLDTDIDVGAFTEGFVKKNNKWVYENNM